MRLAALQLGLLQRSLRVLLGIARVAHLLAQGLRSGLVQKVIHLQLGFDLGQVSDQRAAQANEETGKHQRHQPQATPEPFFRQTQGFAHGLLLCGGSIKNPIAIASKGGDRGSCFFFYSY
ncbi:hypothetical protein D3C71_1763050 [compost metagenome]